MKTIKDGGPAFPCSVRRTEKYMDEGGYEHTRNVVALEGGMTLRDYFAGQALAGVLANSDEGLWPTADADAAAQYAHSIADAMIAEGSNAAPETAAERDRLREVNKELLDALDTVTLVIGLTPVLGNKQALQEALDTARAAIQRAEGG